MTQAKKTLATAAALGFLASAPAQALDLSKVQNLVSQGWMATKTTPELVQFSCTTPACPPMAGLAIALSPASDEARDEMISGPQEGLAGYEKGFRQTPTAKACEFSGFKAEKAGETGARVEMDGECPSGLLIKMATLFDKKQSGTISVLASSMDSAKARAIRVHAVAALESALKAAP